jgi:hypothetical protein
MFNSHKTVTITTTAFKIDLIDPAIGMKLFTSHSRTPTTIRTINTCSNGISFYPFLFAGRHFGLSQVIAQDFWLDPRPLPTAGLRGNLRSPVWFK